MINISNIFPDSTAELLEKGKSAAIGEIRTWSGKKYQKTANGWVPVKAGNSNGPQEKEDGEKSSNRAEELYMKLYSDGLTKEEFAEYKELTTKPSDTKSNKTLSNKSTWKQIDEYAKNSLDENQLHEFKVVTFDRYTSSGRGDRQVAIQTLRKMTEEGKDAQTAFKEAFNEKVYGNPEGSLGKKSESQPQEQSEQQSSEQPESQSQEKQYTPEQLDTYAKAASDKALKAASVSGNEILRIAAKKELNRRKQEGLEIQKNENPFEDAASSLK